VDWYALLVKPQHEKTVHQHLALLGRDSVVPLYHTRRRWSGRIRELDLPLFPGYVFCRLAPGEKLALLSVSGVRSIIAAGNTPASIPDSEIAAIQSIVRAGVPVRPWPYLKPGRRVRIESGPLQGVGGLLRKIKNTWQLVVAVELIRRAVIIELEPAWLRSVIAPAATVERPASGLRPWCNATGALAPAHDPLRRSP
jgi:transcription antitermination factor NusG